MKRLSPLQKAWNVRRTKHAEKRRHRTKARKRHRDRGTGFYERVVLEVPANFNLHENVAEALDFFGRLRKTVLIERKLGLIDFRSCTNISAGAGLILAAETDRCRNLRFLDGKPTVTGTYPRDPSVGIFLDHLGFFRMLKLQGPGYGGKDAAPTRFIDMRSGRRDRGQAADEVATVADSGPVHLDGDAKRELYEALLEAMNNVTAHAYPQDGWSKRLPVLPGQWWAAGHRDSMRREIGVLIYDQGVGIPETLPKSRHGYLLAKIRAGLKLGNSDAEHIRAAMEIGRTRMQGTHRGRGMASLSHAVSRATDGHLLILSGTGGYLHTSDGVEKIFPLPTSIGGTFIEWRIRDDNLITWSDAR